MAKDIFRSPLAEVRWAHLISPRHQLDKSKSKAWTTDLLLANTDEKAQSFLLAMEDQFIALHGSRKRRAEKGFPWKADKEKPSEITVVVAFDIYDWEGENGCGMTFQPSAVQVVEFVPYEQVDPTDGIEAVEGYNTNAVFRPDAATDTGEAPPVTPLSER